MSESMGYVPENEDNGKRLEIKRPAETSEDLIRLEHDRLIAVDKLVDGLKKTWPNCSITERNGGMNIDVYSGPGSTPVKTFRYDLEGKTYIDSTYEGVERKAA
ncbi:MAG: hypothetical protein M1426_02270 [Patescibacteria group bacterium]|nr:hypothetical protein [Patescibacteria group bacterium]